MNFERGMREYRNDPYSSEHFGNANEKPNAQDVNKPNNCSDPDVLIKPISFSDDYWKNKVVIGCTVAVAIEVLIVLLMVMYWEQIRWTLRKLTCPCDYLYHRRHEPMHRQDAIYETNIDVESDDSLPIDQEMQIYAPSSHSNSADGSDHDRGHASANALHGYSQIGFPSLLARNGSSHCTIDGDDGDDEEIDDGRTCSLIKPLESNHSYRPTVYSFEEGDLMQVHAIVHNCSSNSLSSNT